MNGFPCILVLSAQSRQWRTAAGCCRWELGGKYPFWVSNYLQAEITERGRIVVTLSRRTKQK